MFTLCLFAGAVANAAYASDNSDTYDNGCDVNDNDRSNDAQDACDNLATVRDAEGATAVSLCLLCTHNYVYHVGGAQHLSYLPSKLY